MKIKIIYPFIDLRKFNDEFSQYVTSVPSWPVAETGFIRCLGSIDKDNIRSNSCITKNGLAITMEKYHEITSIKRKIIFPYNNDFIGIYLFQFEMLDSTFKYKYKNVDSLFEMFCRDINVNVRNLQSPKETANILKLKKKLCLQYHWSTRLFEIKKGSKIIKVENLDDIKMCNYLLFYNPYFIVQSKGKVSRFDNQEYYKFSDSLYHYEKTDYNKNLRIVHFQTSNSWISQIRMKEIGIKIKHIIDFEVFFSAILTISQNNFQLNIDKSDNLLKVLIEYLSQINEGKKGERDHFNAWKKYLSKTDTDYFKAIINKITANINSSVEIKSEFCLALKALYQNPGRPY